jgi:flagellin
MGLRINQNIAAQNAYRNLSVTDNQMSKSLEKLSSGFRINRAADDAAGLSISEGLRAQVGGLKVAVRNAQDAISVVQTAEGALNEVTSMLQRMRDLSVQANNASLDADAKQAAQTEFEQLGQEIDRIGGTTAFGKSKLLDGNFGASNQATGTALTSLPSAVAFTKRTL